MPKHTISRQLDRSIKLAHLKLGSEEKASLVEDVGEILQFVRMIDQSEKKGAKIFGKSLETQEKEFPQTEKRNALREDNTDQFENTKLLLREAPEKKLNLIKVKRI